MSNIRPSNLPIEETDLIGFVHTDRGIDGSAKFNLANVSSALNLDGMATQAPSNVAITGGSITGITDLAVADGGTGASTLTGYVKGTGTAALTASATIPNTDITGLGTMSTQDASNVAITGGTINGTTIGGSTAAAGTFTDLTGSTKVATPFVDATTSAGGQLRNASGTSQLAWGAGGGSNLTLEVATNINPANASVSIAPTGTGTVTINPATAGTMNNVAIGGSTAAAGAFTTASASTSVTTPLVTNAGTLAVSATGANVITASTNGAERMRIDSAGNVGIGTTSPAHKLHVAGTGADIAATDSAVGTRIISSNASSAGFVETSTNHPLVIRTNQVARMTLDTSGNVGIGVSSFGTSAASVIGIANGTAPSSSPANMGQLYVEGGALKYRGSSGTVTTIANA